MVSLILTIMIIASFPTSSTETKNIVNDKKELKMLYTLDGEVNTLNVIISTKDYQQIEESFNTLSEYLRINMPKYLNDHIFSDEERYQIGAELEKVFGLLQNTIPNLPPVDVNCLVDILCIDFPCLLFGDAIISVGFGSSCIPFYCYEAFLGIMLRPIIIKQCVGYTGFLNLQLLPPRIEYGDRLGIHKIRTFGFIGLYIYLGDLGVDMPFGPQLLIGTGLVCVGPDIP
jgi:hypothetical protein